MDLSHYPCNSCMYSYWSEGMHVRRLCEKENYKWMRNNPWGERPSYECEFYKIADTMSSYPVTVQMGGKTGVVLIEKDGTQQASQRSKSK